MAGLTLTLETGKSTLLNTQVQIQTASHNIANADNTAYARQQVALTANAAYLTMGAYIGTGASVSQITQLRDQFLEQRLMNATSDQSRAQTLASELEQIQSALTDDGTTGISGALGDFWDSWDLLAQNPGGVSEQTAVYQTAQNLADAIRSAYERLDSIATDDIPGKIEDTVAEANTLIDRIADLNQAIAEMEVCGATANDLRDLRYQALVELSELIPVQYSEDDQGMVTLGTTDEDGGVSLVSGATITHITTEDTISGGKLGGLREAAEDLDGYLDRLDDFAGNLISQVNSIHGQDGGAAVFTGTDASTITASTDFLDGVTASDESGRAQAMANLQDTKITFDDGRQATLGDYLGDIQGEIGSDTEQAISEAEYNEALRSQLETQQQSVSGVSLDEEMVNVLQFQQIYQAAAKVISTAAQLLSTVINMVE